MPRKQGASEEYAYGERQLQHLWNTCKEDKDRVIVGLLGYMGMRVGEAAHLKSEWVREDGVHIPSSMPCPCNECSERGHWQPKTKASIRVVPIPGFFCPVLIAFLKYSPGGLRMTRQAIWYRVEWLIDKASLPHGFPHSLRASAATLYATKGMNAMELCVLFGWSRIAVGEHYLQLSQAKAGVQKKMKEIYGA